jgi:hypothetical protein
MQAQTHPLEPFFQQAVRNSYEGKLGLHDPDVTSYVARLLCEFSDAAIFTACAMKRAAPFEELEEMERAADPVNGTAPSFDAERALRKHIGDYALFVAGMYPEAADPAAVLPPSFPEPSRSSSAPASRATSSSASSISSSTRRKRRSLRAFPTSFERWLLGLTLVREDLGPRKPLQLPPRVN